MVEVTLELNSDVHENANKYFSKSKKLKAKIPGIEKTIERTKKEIEEFEKNREEYNKKKEHREKINSIRKQEWFERFRYTYTYSGNLVVFGKDAGTNEVILKKYLDEKDIVMHTEAPGSPFGIIKNVVDENGDLKISKDEINEVAQVICSFSSQWKRGFGTADAFWVYPDQVSKKAVTGEYISKGSFMVRGEKNIIKNIVLQIALGVIKKEIEVDGEKVIFQELFSGNERVVKKICGNKYVKLEPGQDKYKTMSKEIKKRLNCSIEDLPTWIPNGSKILKK